MRKRSNKRKEISKKKENEIDRSIANIERRINCEYRPIYCDMVIDLMSEGYSIYEVAQDIQVSVRTLYRWGKEFPEFAQAIEIGFQYSQAWWEKEARINLKEKKFNTVLWTTVMKNKFSWKDQSQRGSYADHKPSFAIEKGEEEETAIDNPQKESEEEKAAKVVEILISSGYLKPGADKSSKTETE